MEKSLTDGTPWKGILSFMFPVFMGLLLQQFYNTADTIIVGNFAGESSLAAVGACGVLTLVFLALANGFSAGACVLIAQLFGAGKEQEMRRQALSSLLVMIGMGIVATAVGVFISRFALKYILATPESLLSMADTYFKIYALGLLFQFGYNIIAAILRGIGDSKATLYFLLIASVINIRFSSCWLLRFPCQVRSNLFNSFCFLFSAFRFISRGKQRTLFYLCCNKCISSPCYFNLYLAGNSCNRLSHDLVECFIWVGVRLYYHMGAFLQREMETSY